MSNCSKELYSCSNPINRFKYFTRNLWTIFLCAYVRVTDFHYLLVSLIGCLFISVCLYSRNIVFTKNYLYNDYLNQEATFRFQFIFLCWTNISISIEVYEDHKQKTALKYLITVNYTENFSFFSNKSLCVHYIYTSSKCYVWKMKPYAVVTSTFLLYVFF